MAQESVAYQPQIGTLDVVSSARKRTIIVASVLIGLAIAVLWSAQLVDTDIGVNGSSAVLGYNTKTGSIGSGLGGLFYAFVAGVAGTFTACNVAVFSAVGPMIRSSETAGDRVRHAMRQVGWLSVGLIVVAGLYGAIGAAVGTGIPELSTKTVTSHHIPVRSIQSYTVFVLLGLIFIWLGLAAINVVPDPLGRLTARWPQTPLVVMGALIAGFLIGRPYPLFRKMFTYAAQTHNPAYGALAFILTALGNIVLIALLFLALSSATGFQRWLQAKPGRVATLTAAGLIIGGAFMFFYWGPRGLSHYGIGWFPKMPWH